MSEYMFGVSTRPISTAEANRRDEIARQFGVTFVGPLTTAGNEGRSWYATEGRGHPFDGEVERKVLAAVADSGFVSYCSPK